MISLVNGYICRCSTDVAEALQGKKPPAKAGELPYSSGSEGKISAFAERPVTRADGSNEVGGAQLSTHANGTGYGLAGAGTSSFYAELQSEGHATAQTSGGSHASGTGQTSASGINLLV